MNGCGKCCQLVANLTRLLMGTSDHLAAMLPVMMSSNVAGTRTASRRSSYNNNNNYESIYKALCIRIIKPAQRLYTDVNVIPEELILLD